jgi:hypothetical protein
MDLFVQLVFIFCMSFLFAAASLWLVERFGPKA